MVSDVEKKIKALKRQREVLRARAERMPVHARNETYRKMILIDDELARYDTTNRSQVS